LESFHIEIEGIHLNGQPDLIPVLKDIVTLRAIMGSPLRSFTIHVIGSPKKKWELIGTDRSSTMEEVVPVQIFRLDIFDLRDSGLITAISMLRVLLEVCTQ
jgi:hypothetical protein